MGIFKLLSNGIANTNRKYKIVVILWALNFLFALMVVFPIFSWLDANLSRSLMGDKMLQGFNMMWMGDTAYKLKDSMSFIGSYFMIPLFGYLLFHIFLNGGIVGRILDPGAKITARDFFRDCGAYFGRFFRLFLLSIPIYAIFLGIGTGIIGGILDAITKNAASRWPLIIAGNIRFVFMFLFFSIANMFLDYTKIRIVATGNRKVLKEALFTLKFLIGRFFKALGLYWMIGLIFIVFTLVYLEIARVVPENSGFLVLIMFLLHQVYMFGRSWLKVNFFASQAELYKVYNPPTPLEAPVTVTAAQIGVIPEEFPKETESVEEKQEEIQEGIQEEKIDE